MKTLAISVLAFLVLPLSAQDKPHPYTKSYSDITTDMAWQAIARAVKEMRRPYTVKANIPKRDVEFGKAFVGFPIMKFARFKVDVSQAEDGKIRIAAVPKTVGNPSEEEMDSVVSDFFVLLEREIGVYWSQSVNQNTKLGQFGALRRSLIGVNVVARIALPAWIEPDGEMAFPPAYAGAKTGDKLTITNLLLCARYPVGEIVSECGTDFVGNRRVMVVLFNGAQARLLPSPRPIQSGGTAAAFGDALDSFMCAYGNAISCLQASQRMNLRELERLQSTMQQSSAESSWATGELLKFQQTGSEVVFELPSGDLVSQADTATAIRQQLSRFVDISPTN